jgi:putative transposase
LVRYRHRRGDDAGLRARLRELAAARRRFGYRRLHVLLAREGITIRSCATSTAKSDCRSGAAAGKRAMCE